jgi:hypothetical protein
MGRAVRFAKLGLIAVGSFVVVFAVGLAVQTLVHHVR